MVFCRYCHKLIPEIDAKFCPFCGKENPIPNAFTSGIGFFFIAVFIIILFGIITSSIYNSGILGNFSTYADIDYNVTIDYPINWQYENDPGGNTVVAFRSPASNTTNSHDAGLSIYVDNLFFNIPLNKSIENDTFDSSFFNNPLSQSLANETFDSSFFEEPLSQSLANETFDSSLLYNPLNKSIENDTFENYGLFLKLPWNLSLDEYSKYRINALRTQYPDVKYTRTSLDGNNAFNVTYTFSSEDTNTKEKKEFRAMQMWTIKNDRAYIITYIMKEEKYSDYLRIMEKMINSFNIL